MKIKMNTISAGPDPTLNWHEGQIREVCLEEGQYWIEKGIAVDHEKAIINTPEKAVVKAPERAVTVPAETAKVNAGVEPAKAPAKAPASSGNINTSAKASTWGTPGAK